MIEVFWSEFVSGLRFILAVASTEANLISECEDDVDQEDDAVDEGEGALGDAGGLAVAGEGSDCLSAPAVVPVLQDENAAGDEQGSADQREEEI